MAWENWGGERVGSTSRGVSSGRTCWAAMPRPYCLAMASPRANTHMTVGAVWSTADTCTFRCADSVYQARH